MQELLGDKFHQTGKCAHQTGGSGGLWCFGYSLSKNLQMLGTDISLFKGLLKIIFFFSRWDMLVFWRVAFGIWKSGGVFVRCSGGMICLGDCGQGPDQHLIRSRRFAHVSPDSFSRIFGGISLNLVLSKQKGLEIVNLSTLKWCTSNVKDSQDLCFCWKMRCFSKWWICLDIFGAR